MALTKEQKQRVLELRKNKCGYRSIANEIGVTKEQVQYFCKKSGLGGFVAKEENIGNKALEIFKDNLLNKHGGMFEYVSGFIDGESEVIIRCVECGEEQTKNAVFARHKKNVRCSNCVKVNRDSKEELVRLIANEKRETKAIVMREVKALRSIGDKHKFYCECGFCGKEFFSKSDKKYCSGSCAMKNNNRTKRARRDKRLSENGDIDLDITIAKIIRRHGKVCYLCGEECDANDYEVRDDGAWVAGNMYPSVEHVIPISKGGTHTWDNVMLAHRICNSIKSDSKSVEDDGQMILNV